MVFRAGNNGLEPYVLVLGVGNGVELQVYFFGYGCVQIANILL